jgi:hypothetical protein
LVDSYLTQDLMRGIWSIIYWWLPDSGTLSMIDW